jgi:hypothetical protein
MSESNLTHDVILDGGMIVEAQSGCVRFFSKSRLKLKNEFVGPLVFSPTTVDPRLLNLFLYSPILYQATQRAKLDAMDLEERIKALGSKLQESEQQHECVHMLAQVIHLQHAMDMAQRAAREGIDFERVDEFINMTIEVKMTSPRKGK